MTEKSTVYGKPRVKLPPRCQAQCYALYKTFEPPPRCDLDQKHIGAHETWIIVPGRTKAARCQVHVSWHFAWDKRGLRDR